MTMVRSQIALVVLTIGVCLLEPRAGSAAQRFHWDWRKAQELVGIRDSLHNATLPGRDKKAIAAAIATQIEQSDFDAGSGESIEKAIMDTRISMVDLNADGIPEVAAQGMVGCGATGNCPFWIFRKTPRGYKALLNGFGQTFTIQSHSTNGFRDIVVSSQNSATESGLLDYRYSRGAYHDVGSYCAEWMPVDGAGVGQLTEPQVTSCDNPRD